MSLIRRFPRSVTYLIRAAAVVALLGLGTFAFGLFVPKPLPVIFSMSIGHGLGMVALLLYVAAIVLDVGKKAPPSRPEASSDRESTISVPRQ